MLIRANTVYSIHQLKCKSLYNDGVKNETLEDKSHAAQKDNSDDRSNQVPAQLFQVIQKRHFVGIFCFNFIFDILLIIEANSSPDATSETFPLVYININV